MRPSMRVLSRSFSTLRALPVFTDTASELSNHNVSCTNGTSFSSNSSTVLTMASPSDSAASSSPGAEIFNNMTSFLCPFRRFAYSSLVSFSQIPSREYVTSSYGLSGQSRANTVRKSPIVAHCGNKT